MTTPDTQQLIEALEYFANRKTIDERLHGRDMTEWDDASVERRIEIMGENKRKHDAAILRAREVLSRARSADEQPAWGAEIAARHEFGDEQPDLRRAYLDQLSSRITKSDCGAVAVEQPTPPDDLVEEEALQRAVEAVAKIEMDREGYPLSRTQEEIYTDACETVNAVLQALSPHLTTDDARRAARLAAGGCYCKDRCDAPVIMGRQTKCLRNPPLNPGQAISRGDHISGEGR